MFDRRDAKWLLVAFALVACAGAPERPSDPMASAANDPAANDSAANDVPSNAPAEGAVVHLSPPSTPYRAGSFAPLEVGRITALAVGASYACFIADRRPFCVGSVPTALDPIPAAAHPDLEADLLLALSNVRCFAARGSAEVRCFGPDVLRLPTDAERARVCGDDAECLSRVARASVALQRRGLVLDAPEGLLDLEGSDTMACALGEGGRIRCWDLMGPPEAPLREMILPDAVALAGGLGQMCALDSHGAVHCWEEWLDPDAVPVPMPIEGVAGAARLEAGGGLGCAWDEAERASCWGRDWIHRRALPDRSAERVPALDGVDALALSEGGDLACALRDGALACWGEARFGQLGRPPRASDHAAGADRINAPGTPPIDDARSVAVGVEHACAVDGRGALLCWGRADRGALGPDHRRLSFAPVEVPELRATALSVQDDRSCARTDGGWRCWGRSSADDRRPEPWVSERSSAPSDATPLSFGGVAACVLRADRIECPRVGRATEVIEVRDVVRNGQAPCYVTAAGTGECRFADAEPPQPMPDVSDAAKVAAAGGRVIATWAPDGTLHLLRRRRSSLQSMRTLRAGGDVTDLVVTHRSVCVRSSEGAVRCAPLEDGPLEQIALPPVAALVGGDSHVCARTTEGEVFCWGGGREGQLGVAATSSEAPVRVPGVDGATSIAAGAAHTCTIVEAQGVEGGRVLCWGADAEGQLGARPAWWHLEPVRLAIRRNDAE